MAAGVHGHQYVNATGLEAWVLSLITASRQKYTRRLQNWLRLVWQCLIYHIFMSQAVQDCRPPPALLSILRSLSWFVDQPRLECAPFRSKNNHADVLHSSAIKLWFATTTEYSMMRNEPVTKPRWTEAIGFALHYRGRRSRHGGNMAAAYVHTSRRESMASSAGLRNCTRESPQQNSLWIRLAVCTHARAACIAI